jgi:hypothetical protein
MKHIKLFEQFVNEASANKIDANAVKWLKQYMPKTAKTINAATTYMAQFNGKHKLTDGQYFIVQPNTIKTDAPIFKLSLVHSWLTEPSSSLITGNSILLNIYQLKPGEDANTSQGDAWNMIGKTYIDTTVFLNEVNTAFELIKKS